MKFCSNCGAQLPEGSKFCTECGQRVAPVEPPVPVQEPAEVPVFEAPAYEVPAAPKIDESPVHVYGQPVQHAFSSSMASENAQSVMHTYGQPVQHNFSAPVPTDAMQSVIHTYGEAAQQSAVPPVQPASEAPVQPESAPQPAPVREPVLAAPVIEPEAPAQPVVEQGSYTPAQSAAPAAKETAKPGFTFGAGGGKKGGKKGLIIGAAAVIAVIVLIVSLFAGGGGDAENPNLGVYNGVSCMVSGQDLGADDEWLELKSDGKATLRLMGDEYSCKWSLDGENLTVEQAGDAYSGTLKDGVIVLDLDGMICTYVLYGQEMPTEAPTEAPAPAEIGYWTLLRTESENADEIMDEETVKMLREMGLVMYIDLKDDGTGELCMDDPSAITWRDGKLIADDGSEASYTVSDGQLSVVFEGMTLIFVPGEADVTVPAGTEAPTEPPATEPPATEPPATEPPATEPPATEPPATEAPSGVTIQDWAGDYYGWWVIDNVIEGDSELVGDWWDCCATFQFNADGTGTLVIWDEDYTKDDPLASLTISGSIVNGTTARIVSEEGDFMGYPVAHADWLFYSDDTVYADTLGFSATYISEGINIECFFFLRPWGVKWDDIMAANPDFMTYYYDDWYLPLVNSGVTSAPTGIVGEVPAQSGGTEAPTGNVSTDALASADWEDCSVSIVGAEHFVDSEGKDAIRVYYDFTNNTDETKCAYNILEYAFEQDGYELVRTWADYENTCPEELNEDRYLRPGASIRCVAQFRMKVDGGPLSATIYNYWNESERLTVQFDPANLPGRPAQELAIAPVTQPMWMANLPGEGVYNENYYIKIESAEYTEGYNGENALRVYFTFTNNSTEECSMWYASTISAYQDGIELDSVMAAVEVTEDDNYSTMIKPGETILTSCCYTLLSTSPVEIEIEGWNNDSLGTIFVLE